MSKNQISLVFDVPDITNPIKLFDNEESNIREKIKTLEIDGDRIKEPSEYFTFDSEGIHNVSLILDEELESMSNLFQDCYYLLEIDLSNLDTSKVTSMSGLFKRCTSLTYIDFSTLDTSNVTDMSEMFLSCSSLTSINLLSLNTSKVTNMNNMFSACGNLEEIKLSKIDTSNVTDMS